MVGKAESPPALAALHIPLAVTALWGQLESQKVQPGLPTTCLAAAGFPGPVPSPGITVTHHADGFLGFF